MFQFTDSQLIFRSSHTLKIFTIYLQYSSLNAQGQDYDIQIQPSGACIFFFLHVSRAQRLDPARTRMQVVQLGAQCTDHWTTEHLAALQICLQLPQVQLLGCALYTANWSVSCQLVIYNVYFNLFVLALKTLLE